MIWIVIGKMFINQSFTKNKAVVNGKTIQIYEWISQPRSTISRNPSVMRCSTWCRLLNSFQYFENHNNKCKKMDSGDVIKNSNML